MTIPRPIVIAWLAIEVLFHAYLLVVIVNREDV
jgi:hypothetical protein